MAFTAIQHQDPVPGFDVDYGAFSDGTWGVTVTEDAGYRYTHRYSGSMTEDEAHRLCMRVRKAVRERGIAALDDTLWSSDIVYGSEAYQQEEPWIVWNEKEDARIFG
jgi:hypothetical protein